MTDNDIREYIGGLGEPIFLRDVMSELTSKDPTISWKRVTRLMREMGYENKVRKNALNEKGKGSSWFRTGTAVTTDDDDEDEVEVENDEDNDAEYDEDVEEDDDDAEEDDDDAEEDDDDADEDDEDGVVDAEKTEVTKDTKDTKARTRSTAEALRDVSAKNDADSGLLQRLFEGLTRSRSLKEELMKRQQEMLLELARRILGLYGTEKERREYGDF